MTESDLTKSPVVFIEDPHGYILCDKRLSGITSLIHDVLHLGVYPDASDYVKNYKIPRAGEYGTAVHHAIESYDKLGIKVTAHPMSERFRENGEEYWFVEHELESYITHRQGYEPIANEYTVSDEVRYASNIDNIWIKNETQGIWLVDTKTNNLKYYPDGVDALKEYLSWQLSCYAFLFERQNPGLKVEGLACNWLRHEDAAFWIIDRKPDEDVEKLLSVEWTYGDFGFIYAGVEIAEEILGPSALVPKKADSNVRVLPEHVVKYIYDIESEVKRLTEKQEEMKTKLREAMEKHNVKSWDSGMFKATIAADSTSTSFDSARFKKEHPDLYKQYTKTTTKKGGFTIKLKE